VAIKLKTLNAVTVTQAGVRKRLSETSILVYGVSVQSSRTNTGYQYMGDENVTSSNGYEFGPTDVAELPPPNGSKEPMQFDIKDVWVDSSTAGAEFRISAWVRV